jgi:hypothetical protein
MRLEPVNTRTIDVALSLEMIALLVNHLLHNKYKSVRKDMNEIYRVPRTA